MSAIKRCGTVSLLGRANVGKSSIMNALIGEKIAIVSPKPQTTRNRIVGVLTEGENQFVFMDTPGLHSPKSKLGDRMVKTVYETAEEVDAALLVIDPRVEKDSKVVPQVGKPEAMLLSKIKKLNIPCILAINKIDLADKAWLLPWIDAYAKAFPFADIIPISAKTGEGLEDLTASLAKLLPEVEEGDAPLFDEDSLTDQPERILAAEFVRERLLWHLEKEIPHGIATLTETFEEGDNGVWNISVVIVCERQNHKGIIIGRQGGMLKQVGAEARAQMEKLFGCQVFLTLFVRVKDDWRNSDFMLNEFGY